MSEFPIVEICCVDIAVPDVILAERFYTTAWGLEVAARQDDKVYLRATGRDPHVLVLHPSAAAAVLSITFRTSSLEDLPRLTAAVSEAGGSLVREIALVEEPGGGTAVTVETPEGYVLRFIHGDAVNAEGECRKDFPFRLSHVNLNCADIAATRRFFEEALGFKLTDRSKAMAFLRCNQDHHTVVLADSGVNGLNHIAFMMPDLESVMRGAGRMIDHGYPIGWGVGRHGPGNNIFAYFLDPFGIVIEYTAEVLQVDDSYVVRGPEDWIWPPGRTDHWGIAPPKSAKVKDAQLAVQFRKPSLWKM
jgi:catechol 2,3-dioxygenase-like lactoylglutathione lyase family enzyme